ncbi:MAG: L-aspartate oxidase [Clostridiales bacterium]|nr:L-aspartate oxidase [Clostridiales bacterium]
MILQTDVLIVGTGVGGLFCALHIPEDKNVLMITKAKADESDSFLAQGGICVLKSEEDYDSYFEDTMRAGHYENNPEAVDIMLRSSRGVIDELIGMGVEFERDENGELLYTKEGAHSTARILFHEDVTGKEITSKLLSLAKSKKNIKIIEDCTMVDIIEQDGACAGIAARHKNGVCTQINADYTVLATGGVGGLYKHSTNYRHLSGDGLAVSIKHGIELENIDYIQIHPTTLYSGERGRRFLISESVRGEGAVLYNSHMQRFTDELQPRDVVTAAIYEQMKKDKARYVWLSMKPIDKKELISHFPHILEHCRKNGYDVTKEPIPVVPSQHYFMGGIKVNMSSKTSMDRLYATGETACNGVHGRNRLASNSLLESLVFAKRAAMEIGSTYKKYEPCPELDMRAYEDCDKDYGTLVLKEIERSKTEHEQNNNKA